MRYFFDLRSASLSNATVMKRSTEGASYPLQIGVSPDAFDDHSGGVIDTTIWASIGGSNTEGAFIGTNCIRIAGPAAPAWDTDGIIYKPAITPTVGTAITGQFIMTDGAKFAVGLQEYAFTVDDIVTPASWTLKYDAVQTTDNSTYVLLEPGRMSVVKGGSAGTITEIADTSWKVSDAALARPIYISFLFSNNGYEIYANQPSVWSAPKKLATVVRSTGVHAAAGYSFCVNKNNPDNTLGFYGLCSAFKSDATVSNYLVVDSTSAVLNLSSLQLNSVLGGIISQDGAVYVQFPTISPKWYTLTEVAAESATFTGYYAYPINFKLSGDSTINHPIYVESTT